MAESPVFRQALEFAESALRGNPNITESEVLAALTKKNGYDDYAVKRRGIGRAFAIHANDAIRSPRTSPIRIEN